jgi:hypothetical protein
MYNFSHIYKTSVLKLSFTGCWRSSNFAWVSGTMVGPYQFKIGTGWSFCVGIFYKKLPWLHRYSKLKLRKALARNPLFCGVKHKGKIRVQGQGRLWQWRFFVRVCSPNIRSMVTWISSRAWLGTLLNKIALTECLTISEPY